LTEIKVEKLAQIGLMGSLLIGYPIYTAYYLLKYRDHLDWPDVRMKVERLYKGIALNRSYYAVLYYPVSLIRRCLFVVIPLWQPGHQGV